MPNVEAVWERRGKRISFLRPSSLTPEGILHAPGFYRLFSAVSFVSNSSISDCGGKGPCHSMPLLRSENGRSKCYYLDKGFVSVSIRRRRHKRNIFLPNKKNKPHFYSVKRSTLVIYFMHI